jgi:thiosulfate/3-mercaptopyruvate sulfurtransferase
MENFDPLVTTDWLAEHVEDPDVRVVDIRGYVKKTDLGGGRQKAEYLAACDEYDGAHVPGAVYVDWTSSSTITPAASSPRACGGP